MNRFGNGRKLSPLRTGPQIGCVFQQLISDSFDDTLYGGISAFKMAVLDGEIDSFGEINAIPSELKGEFTAVRVDQPCSFGFAHLTHP